MKSIFKKYATQFFLAGFIASCQVIPSVAQVINPTQPAAMQAFSASSSYTNTSIGAKLQQSVSIADFGANGNGVFNNRTALVNAVTKAAGRPVTIPSGTYNIGSTYAAPVDTRIYMQQGASFTGSAITGATFIYDRQNTTPVSNTVMAIENLLEQSSYPLRDEAGIWPFNSYTFAGFSKEFTSTMTSGTSPAVALFAFANNNDSSSDVVAIMGDAVARTNNDSVFGGNLIARNVTGTTGTKLTGLEIDLEPATGTTVSSQSIGLAINAYSIAMPAPAIQLGGLSGGTFNNGLIINAVTGAGVSAAGGSTMSSLVNSTQGTFTDDAVMLGNGQKIQLQGTALAHAKIYNDSSNNVRVVMGSGSTVAIRNNADTANLFSFSNAGNFVATTLNGNTLTTGSGTLTLAAGKTLTANNSITVSGTDSTTMTFPTTSATVARTDAAQSFTGAQTMTGDVWLGGAAGANGLYVPTIGSAVNYHTMYGATSGNHPTWEARGAGTNINLYATAKGAGGFGVFTNGGGATAEQFFVSHTASAVNYLNVTGGASTTGPTISSAGSATDPDINVTPKGAGKVVVPTLNATVALQVGGVSILPALSGTTGSIGGSALLAGACSSGTATVTGATTGMAIAVTPVTYPGDGSFWLGYVSSSNTVTVKVCAAVAETPTASNYNVRVIQ